MVQNKKHLSCLDLNVYCFEIFLLTSGNSVEKLIVP